MYRRENTVMLQRLWNQIKITANFISFSKVDNDWEVVRKTGKTTGKIT